VPRFHLSVAAGFEAVVARAVAEDVAGLTVTDASSGMVRVTAPAAAGAQLAGLPYLSVVLRELASRPFRRLDRDVYRLAADLRDQPVPTPIRRFDRYRLRIAEAGRLAAVDPRAREALERQVTAWSGMRPVPQGDGAEIWVTHRRDERDIVLGIRLDAPRTGRLAPGALRPVVAAALVRVVPPGAGDRVADPFAGSGAIPVQRARHPYADMVASDVDPAAVAGLRRLAGRGALGANARVARLDVRDPVAVRRVLGKAALDRVVTDPPWGRFRGAPADVVPLYRALGRALAVAVAPGGLAVVLTGAPGRAQDTLLATGGTGRDAFPVLVNGTKAEVLVVAY
jgi:23S rRNA G2445 N2-methylase RlmL